MDFHAVKWDNYKGNSSLGGVLGDSFRDIFMLDKFALKFYERNDREKSGYLR